MTEFTGYFAGLVKPPDIVVGSVADDVQTLDLSALCRSAAIAGTLLFAFAGSRRLNHGLPSICIGILIFDPVMAESFKGLFIFDLAASRTLLVFLSCLGAGRLFGDGLPVMGQEPSSLWYLLPHRKQYISEPEYLSRYRLLSLSLPISRWLYALLQEWPASR